MVQAGPLPPGDKFEPPEGGWTQTVVARASASTDGKGAKALLTEAEAAQIGARGTAQRQADRQLGRVAAKRALSLLTGHAPSTFEILNEQSGRPVVRGDDGPKVSISHRAGEAVAVATSSGHPGIDLEIVQERPASFAQTWFRPEERAWSQGVPRRESQIWAIKEAVLKSLGTGMALSPVDIEVLEVCGDTAQVVLWGDARMRHLAMGGGELKISLEAHGEMVVAVAWMAS